MDLSNINALSGLQTKFIDVQCDSHGTQKAMAIVGKEHVVKCPKCVIEKTKEIEEARQAEQISAGKQFALEALMDRSAVPVRFRDKTLDSFESGAELPEEFAALEKCRAYAADFKTNLKEGRSLLVVGSVGTGKNHLTIGIGHEISKQGNSFFYTTHSDAINAVRETYRRDSETSKREAIKHFVVPDLLILDEVGRTNGGHDESGITFDIINGRYEACKPTIIISNLPVKSSDGITGLIDFLGEACMDRLRDGGKLISCNWESYRARSAARMA